MDTLLAQLVNRYASKLGLPAIPSALIARAKGPRSAPLSLIGTLVAKQNSLEIAGKPVLFGGGFDMILAARTMMLESALHSKNAQEIDLLVTLAFDIGLIDEDDDVELPTALVARMNRLLRRPVKTLNGAHLTVLARLVRELKRPEAHRRVRALYDVGTAVSDASYGNELALEKLVGSPLPRASTSSLPAEREAALCALNTLLWQLTSGRLYPEVERYAEVLIESGLDAHLALLQRYQARLVLGHLDAERDLDAFVQFEATLRAKTTRESAASAVSSVANARAGAAQSLLMMANRARRACAEGARR